MLNPSTTPTTKRAAMLNPSTLSTKRAAQISSLERVASATSCFATKASLFVAAAQTRAMRATTTTSICILAANTADAIEVKVKIMKT